MKRLIPLLICLPMLLTACSTTPGLPITDSTPTVTLPPAEINYVAPIGDAALDYTDTAVLCLPSRDGLGLTEVETEIRFSLVRPVAESIMRALVAHTGTRDSSSLGGDVRLSLYGANPVEVSRDVATVNLSASALQLGREQLYIVCQAITNTLTKLEDINYVNVLIVDKPVGLDIGNTLPMGALRHNAAQDLGAVYEQLLSRRVAVGDTASTPLSANVALYFPLQNNEGLVCEARTISFENQRLSDMVTVILREIASGPADKNIGSTQLPLLADLLTKTPVAFTNAVSGGQVISLDFAHNLDDMLEAYGITRRQCTASLCYTLTSFFPNVSGITLSINGSTLDAMMLTEEDEAVQENAHVFLRSDFSELIYDYCTLYFLDRENHRLSPTRRAISYHQRTNPRTLLCELALGPQPGDSRTDLLPVMPLNSISDPTLLGFALADNVLLTNFAPAFSEIGKALSPSDERWLAFALVNTLCTNDRVDAVCFFKSGSQLETFTGEIQWTGLFFPLPTAS